MTTTAYIGIGANLGDARATVEYAIAALSKLPQTSAGAQSSLFVTAPIDSSGDDYINAVLEINTELDAYALLFELQKLELACGRERPYRNAPRTLDLDLLLYGEQSIHQKGLIVPHPRMTVRAFVLIPLLQIAPFIQIPNKGAAHAFAPMVADQEIRKLD
ncbi:MAG: 2-amino-4-hydroxy-6-hydroxymethyldihydropteridine diphosphokinase [Undibacterium sp.]|nr:2-amino-4-hydroxy-6-hydroxymethyldihydropteridine diphosphokinase [Undibacterium sp.]